MSNDITEKPSLEILLDQNLNDLINCTASQFFMKYGKCSIHSAMITQEDLALEGFMGATLAYESFDPSLGYTDDIVRSFRTHAFPYIKNRMLVYCRKFGHSLSISEKAAREDWRAMIDVGVVHIDQFENDDHEFDVPVGSGVEVSQDVDEYFLIGFSRLERDLVKDHMIEGYSLQECSDRHRISKSRAGEIIRGLTDRMRERAENYVKND